MATTLAKIKREYAATESALASLLIAGQWGQAQDTGAIIVIRRDGVTADAFDSRTRFAGQTSTTGTSLIGTPGLTGITPAGGSSGAASTLQAMLTGLRDGTILRAPYSASLNTIQPTAAAYVPLILRGAASQSADLLQIQSSTPITLSRFDSSGNLFVGPSGGTGTIAVAITSSGGGIKLQNVTDRYQLYVSGAESGSNAGSNLNLAAYGDSGTLIDNALTLARVAGGTLTIRRPTSISSTLGVTLATTLSSTLAVTGIQSNSEAIRFVANGTSGAGSIFRSAANGITIQAVTGSSNQLNLADNSGFSLLSFDTSGNATFANPVSIAGGAYLYIATLSNNQISLRSTGSNFGFISNTGTSPDAWALGYGTTPTTLGTSAITWNTTGAVGVPSGDLTISRSNVGSDVLALIQNTNNSNASSNAQLRLTVGGSSAGDPYIHFTITSVVEWSAGVDNSDSDKFKISGSGALGTNDALIIDTSFAVTFPNGDVTISRNTAGAESVLAISNLDNTNSVSNARLRLGVAGGNGGDPFIRFAITGGTDWALGADNSVSGDPFKISKATGLGTNDALIIDSNLLATFGGSVVCNGGNGTYFKFPTSATTPSSPAAGWCYWDTVGGHLMIYSGSAWQTII